MENEERIPIKAKQAWQSPEIIDLDMDQTESGPTLTGGENYYTSPHAS